MKESRPRPVDDYLSYSADSKPFYPEIENINLDGAKTFVFRPELPEYEDCVDPILSQYSATQRPNLSRKSTQETNYNLCDQSGKTDTYVKTPENGTTHFCTPMGGVSIALSRPR